MLESDKNKFQNLIFQMHLRKVEEVYRAFEERNISPVLIKGLAAAINYPKPFQRIFSDIDLAVDPNLYDKAGRVISENKFNVDLHKGLRHLDTADWEDLYENSLLTNIGGISIRILRPEDHLRVLCIHWLNDGGADRTRLWDIFFAVKNSSQKFSWDRFFDPVDDKRKEWLTVVLLAANYYLGLDLGDIKCPVFLSGLPEWIKAEIEKEWASDIRLTPLQSSVGNYKNLLPQLRKRFPPNVLQAIVETGSEIGRDRFYLVRAKDFFKRAKNSLRHLILK